MKNLIVSSGVVLGMIGLVQGASLNLDFQPTGGTTAAGFLPFEATNADVALGATDTYSEFGTTITVTMAAVNLPDGAPDFRAVTRNGTDGADNPANDWIGVDTRTGGVDVVFRLTLSGLPAGAYTWLSGHHDGGVNAASNGNLDGLADYSFTDATGTANVANGVTFTRQDQGDAPSTLGFNFTSDGSDVVFEMTMDEGQGTVDDTNSLFALANSLVITDAVPEPSTALLAVLGIFGGLVRRKR